MSYCRWSSDNFQCDVYVYAASEGWCIHVAANKTAEDPPENSREVAGWWEQGEAGVKAYVEQHTRLTEWMTTAAKVPIGLAHDGGYFIEPTALACAERLISLKEMGYRVPQYAIDDLIEESESAP